VRAILHRPKDGPEERFLAESDVNDLLRQAKTSIMVSAEYAKATVELATAWEAYKKDQQNITLLVKLSASVQRLSQITLMAAQLG
jgi:hypothetical protein